MEFWVAVIGLATAIIGSVRWLMEVRYKHNERLESQRTRDAEKIEILKSENYSLFVQKIEAKLALIETALSAHKQEMAALKSEIQKSSLDMRIAAEKYEETQRKADRVLVALKEHVEFVDSKFRQSDSDITRIDSEIIKLGKDLIMIKSKSAKKD